MPTTSHDDLPDDLPDGVPALLRRIYEDLRAMNGDRLRPQPFAVAVRLVLHPRYRCLVMLRVAQFLFVRPTWRAAALLLCGRILRSGGAEIAPEAVIGPRLRLVHTTGIVIGSDVRAGADLVLHQHVTLGDRRPGHGQPRLGDRVRLGAGAVVLGPVHVGDDAVIGAGALVIHDVPAGVVVKAGAVRPSAAATPATPVTTTPVPPVPTPATVVPEDSP